MEDEEEAGAGGELIEDEGPMPEDEQGDEERGEEGDEGQGEGGEGEQGMVIEAGVEQGVAQEGGVSAQGGGDEQRITTPFLTKFERARILGTRALQIRHVYFSALGGAILSRARSHSPKRPGCFVGDRSMNAPLMVQLEGETEPLEIAEKELKQKKVPFTVRRYLPDGSYEDWALHELIQEENI